MKWTLLHKLVCPVDVPLVIHNLDTCMSRKNVSNSLLDVLACSIAVSFFSLFVFPPPGSSKCSTTLKYTQQNYFPESSYKIYMLQVC